MALALPLAEMDGDAPGKVKLALDVEVGVAGGRGDGGDEAGGGVDFNGGFELAVVVDNVAFDAEH